MEINLLWLEMLSAQVHGSKPREACSPSSWFKAEGGM